MYAATMQTNMNNIWNMVEHMKSTESETRMDFSIGKWISAHTQSENIDSSMCYISECISHCVPTRNQIDLNLFRLPMYEMAENGDKIIIFKNRVEREHLKRSAQRSLFILRKLFTDLSPAHAASSRLTHVRPHESTDCILHRAPGATIVFSSYLKKKTTIVK